MSREFLTWAALEVWYDLMRSFAVGQGTILSREAFLKLTVLPMMNPGTAAQMFGMGAEIVGLQLIGRIMPNRPVSAPNGRN